MGIDLDKVGGIEGEVKDGMFHLEAGSHDKG